MANLNLFDVLQTNSVQRLIHDHWYSHLEISGSFLEHSTSFDYLAFGRLDFLEDFESKRRFNKLQNFDFDVRPHRFTYQVWYESIGTRFFFEILFFLVAVVYFQWNITMFTNLRVRTTQTFSDLAQLNVLID